MWTSGANKPYIGVTIHWVDWNSFPKRLDSVELRTKPIPYPHTAVDILETFKSILLEEGLSEKVKYVVSDNGSNVVNAFNCSSEFNHLRCAAHSLQLIVRLGVNDISIKSLLDNIRELNVLLSRPKQEQLLREAQQDLGEVSTVCVIKEVDTR